MSIWQTGAGGNVGIGVTNPGYTLTISGQDYSTGRRYTSDWFSNYGSAGLYNDTYYNSFYRNDAQYGNWKIDSGNAINGWYGIRFTGQEINLMMGNGTDKSSGIHMNGTGWMIYSDPSRNLYIPGDITAYWSDRRLKKDFVQVEDYDEILNGLTAYRFKWNALGEKVTAGAVKENDENLSLIAQDVQAVLPNAVKVNKAGQSADPAKKDEVFDYLTIDFDKITPVLVEALKQTRKELIEVKERLFALEKIVSKQ
jgi:Chaperone of endosialidase